MCSSDLNVIDMRIFSCTHNTGHISSTACQMLSKVFNHGRCADDVYSLRVVGPIGRDLGGAFTADEATRKQEQDRKSVV